MKQALFGLLTAFMFAAQGQTPAKIENVIIVTFDGYRWQELFGGAQKVLVHSKYTKDKTDVLNRYWDDNANIRRAKLMPFFWSTIARNGQLYGNRKLGARFTLTNGYKFSFPGYNEIFTGWGDKRINSNGYGYDPNLNLFDFLNDNGFKGKMAAFATWDAFPKIINDKRNGVPVYVSAKATPGGGATCNGLTFDHWQTTVPPHNPGAMEDSLTYHFAKEYIARNHPKVAFIGFDETDDDAHEGDYNKYLNIANTLDGYMKDLWDFIQSDPQYKDKTAIIITCDHGRGNVPLLEWRHHGHVYNAEHIWLAAMGPGIAAKGEITDKTVMHQNQIAATVVKLLGYTYKTDHFSGPPIEGIVGK